MTRAAYNGHEALTFSDYIDAETGKTLHAEPGGTYDVAPASGRNVEDLPAGWFTPVEALEPWSPAADEGEAGEPAHDDDPDVSREF